MKKAFVELEKKIDEQEQLMESKMRDPMFLFRMDVPRNDLIMTD